ncbi:MAG: serine hydroxymethyltransferase [Candidatus Colwellbacteria bacterium]|nr:serine hydroxymethyltransferase [Candidatus Colwellbacteria bacterium]
MKDRRLWNLIHEEVKRQNETLNLIASENFTSVDILKVLGSPLTNKYSEGYPGRRYYPGNEYYDKIENLAKERALKTFGLNPEKWGVNVQSYSGSPANLAVYVALMEPGEKLMGMELSSGGHLTHGHKVSVSGKWWKPVQYGVSKRTGLISYGEIERLTKKVRPKIIVSGFTAYPRKIDFKRFGEIAKKAGAYHLADISHIAGLVVAKVHPLPFPHADVVMTTTHKTLRGPRGAVIFARKDKFLIRDGVKLSLAERIDRAVFPGIQGGPHNNVTAAKALMFFEAGRPEFRLYQKQIVRNARALAEALRKLKFRLATGGTDNHLMLVDVRSFVPDGLKAEKMLEEVGIIANRNSIPGDKSPFKPSGLRLGTPALTSRGMKEGEMREVAELIYEALKKRPGVKGKVLKLCRSFPARRFLKV